jgi:hypothetical protein
MYVAKLYFEMRGGGERGIFVRKQCLSKRGEGVEGLNLGKCRPINPAEGDGFQLHDKPGIIIFSFFWGGEGEGGQPAFLSHYFYPPTPSFPALKKVKIYSDLTAIYRTHTWIRIHPSSWI